jgi:mono/diheme cytochrome c family protein
MKIAPASMALIVASLIAGTAVAQGAEKAAPAQAPKPPAATSGADADQALLETQCSSCHSIDQVTSQNKTADEWAETMDRMIDHGMQITPEDNKRLTAFLVAHYGPKGGSK